MMAYIVRHADALGSTQMSNVSVWKFDKGDKVLDRQGRKWVVQMQALINDGAPIYFCASETHKDTQCWVIESAMEIQSAV